MKFLRRYPNEKSPTLRSFSGVDGMLARRQPESGAGRAWGAAASPRKLGRKSPQPP